MAVESFSAALRKKKTHEPKLVGPPFSGTKPKGAK